MMRDPYKVAKAMNKFTVDNTARAQRPAALLAYIRELCVRMDELKELRTYRDFDFDIKTLTLAEQTPTPTANNSSHAPTTARADLAIVLMLTVIGNAATLIEDANDTTDGLAMIAKLIAAYGQTSGDGSAYLTELKTSPSTRRAT